MQEQLLTPKQVRDMLHISHWLLKKLDRTGVLPSIRIGVRGDRRFKLADIEKYIAERGEKA